MMYAKLGSTCENTNHKCTVPATPSPCAKWEWWHWARFVKHVESWEQTFPGGLWALPTRQQCWAAGVGTQRKKKVNAENLSPHCACCWGSPDPAPWTEHPLAAGTCSMCSSNTSCSLVLSERNPVCTVPKHCDVNHGAVRGDEEEIHFHSTLVIRTQKCRCTSWKLEKIKIIIIKKKPQNWQSALLWYY